jgi:hypothetical protein
MLPSSNTDSPLAICGVLVRASQSVLPNHFWLGLKDTVKPQPAELPGEAT